MEAALKAAGADFTNMVFINPYLTDRIPMEVMNRLYAKRFEFGNTPARATIQVSGLPSGANIEFTGVAVTHLAKRAAGRPEKRGAEATGHPVGCPGDPPVCAPLWGLIPAGERRIVA